MIEEQLEEYRLQSEKMKSEKEESGNPFKKTIIQYQQEIENLEILLEELSENYQQEISAKEEKFSQEREKLNL